MKGQKETGIGKVWLSGAGPGDAGLLTVKTRRLLEEADVIVYDALVSAEILSWIPGNKDMIYVGKRAGNHPVPQPEINEILVREAKQGKRVLRLKGGDPFVFGRGGEELERLLEEGIPFEVVPGVTSASAVPAYAGIPITHRDYTSSFHVITGHARKGKEIEIPYEALVKLNGTLLFLMGITALPSICKGLLDAGMDADTPAAVLERGTTSQQRRIISTVSEIAQKVVEDGVRTPAIFMIGKVCKLADTFHWAEKRPLGGRQILVTRPRQNSSKLSGELRALGAQVVELPSIATRPISPNPVLEHALNRFGTRAEEEWLVWTSPIGVQVFFEQLKELRIDIRTLFSRKFGNVRIAAIGSATAKELEQHGLFADLVPDVYCARDLGEQLAKSAAPGSAITVVRAARGSEELLPPLLAAGLSTEDIPLYETEYELHEARKEQISSMLENGEIDVVTFTSASTVRGFVQMLKGFDFRKIRAVCIGEQTAREAQIYNMQTAVSKQASIDSLTEKIVEILRR